MVHVVGASSWMLYPIEKPSISNELIASTLMSEVHLQKFIVESELDEMYEGIYQLEPSLVYSSVVAYLTTVSMWSTTTNLKYRAASSIADALDELGYNYRPLIDEKIIEFSRFDYINRKLSTAMRKYINTKDGWEDAVEMAKGVVDECMDDMLYYDRLHRWLLKEYSNEKGDRFKEIES